MGGISWHQPPLSTNPFAKLLKFLKKSSENAGANENLSRRFPSIPGIAPGVAPRMVVFVLFKSCDAILRIGFRTLRMEFRIPRAAPRIRWNSPRAPRMAFSLRGPQASHISNLAFFFWGGGGRRKGVCIRAGGRGGRFL